MKSFMVDINPPVDVVGHDTLSLSLSHLPRATRLLAISMHDVIVTSHTDRPAGHRTMCRFGSRYCDVLRRRADSAVDPRPASEIRR